MKIYLCGGINGLTDYECGHWRRRAKNLLVGHECVDPMDRDYRGEEENVWAGLVAQDKRDITGCQFLLAHYDRPSFGTAMEIFFAHEQGVRVVISHLMGIPPSPWVTAHSERIFGSLEAATSWILENA